MVFAPDFSAKASLPVFFDAPAEPGNSAQRSIQH